eukprot:gnl/Chilomastix_cuspidata/2873.p1 GENE.gnl/Chilomastix_cuspidata/2873~~gnl/Chilomastix_cuspidata/2873.p1  ORF type:complete len:4706 (+),score=672.78 gnl/Chilomastix_cuspidata/2873:2-14119(+)
MHSSLFIQGPDFFAGDLHFEKVPNSFECTGIESNIKSHSKFFCCLVGKTERSTIKTLPITGPIKDIPGTIVLFEQYPNDPFFRNHHQEERIIKGYPQFSAVYFSSISLERFNRVVYTVEYRDDNPILKFFSSVQKPNIFMEIEDDLELSEEKHHIAFSPESPATPISAPITFEGKGRPGNINDGSTTSEPITWNPPKFVDSMNNASIRVPVNSQAIPIVVVNTVFNDLHDVTIRADFTSLSVRGNLQAVENGIFVGCLIFPNRYNDFVYNLQSKGSLLTLSSNVMRADNGLLFYCIADDIRTSRSSRAFPPGFIEKQSIDLLLSTLMKTPQKFNYIFTDPRACAGLSKALVGQLHNSMKGIHYETVIEELKKKVLKLFEEGCHQEFMKFFYFLLSDLYLCPKKDSSVATSLSEQAIRHYLKIKQHFQISARVYRELMGNFFYHVRSELLKKGEIYNLWEISGEFLEHTDEFSVESDQPVEKLFNEKVIDKLFKRKSNINFKHRYSKEQSIKFLKAIEKQCNFLNPAPGAATKDVNKLKIAYGRFCLCFCSIELLPNIMDLFDIKTLEKPFEFLKEFDLESLFNAYFMFPGMFENIKEEEIYARIHESNILLSTVYETSKIIDQIKKFDFLYYLKSNPNIAGQRLILTICAALINQGKSDEHIILSELLKLLNTHDSFLSNSESISVMHDILDFLYFSDSRLLSTIHRFSSLKTQFPRIYMYAQTYIFPKVLRSMGFYDDMLKTNDASFDNMSETNREVFMRFCQTEMNSINHSSFLTAISHKMKTLFIKTRSFQNKISIFFFEEIFLKMLEDRIDDWVPSSLRKSHILHDAELDFFHFLKQLHEPGILQILMKNFELHAISRKIREYMEKITKKISGKKFRVGLGRKIIYEKHLENDFFNVFRFDRSMQSSVWKEMIRKDLVLHDERLYFIKKLTETKFISDEYKQAYQRLAHENFLFERIAQKDMEQFTDFLEDSYKQLYIIKKTQLFRYSFGRFSEQFAPPAVRRSSSKDKMNQILKKFIEGLKEFIDNTVANTLTGDMSLAEFIACYGEIAPIDLHQYLVYRKPLSKYVNHIQNLYAYKKKIQTVHGLLTSFKVDEHAVGDPIELFSHKQTLSDFEKIIGHPIRTVDALDSYNHFQHYLQPLSRGGNLLQLVFEEIADDFDVTQFYTALQFDSSFAMDAGATVCFPRVQKRLQKVKHIYKNSQMKLPVFWVILVKWIEDLLSEIPSENHEIICTEFSSTADSGADLLQLYESITKDLIDMNYEKIRASIEPSATFTMQNNGEFFILAKRKAGEVTYKLSSEVLDRLRQTTQIASTDNESNGIIILEFTKLIAKLAKASEIIKSLANFGFLNMNNLFGERRTSLEDNPIKTVDIILKNLDKKLNKWKRDYQSALKNWRILNIIPPTELPSLEQNISSKKDYPHQLRYMFQSLGLDESELLFHLRNVKSFERQSACRKILTIGKGITKFMSVRQKNIIRREFRLPDYDNRIYEQLSRMSQRPPFMKGVTMIYVPVDKIVRTMNIAMHCTCVVPFLHEMFFCDSYSNEQELINFFHSSRHVHIKYANNEQALYYLIDPDRLPLKLLKIARQYVRENAQSKFSRLFVITTTSESETTIKPFIEAIPFSTIIPSEVLDSTFYTNPINASFAGWAPNNLSFVRSSQTCTGKSTFIRKAFFGRECGFRKFIITSQDSIQTIIQRIQTMDFRSKEIKGIHFNVTTFPGESKKLIPFFFQILHTRSVQLDGHIYTFDRSIEKIAIELRDAAWSLSDILDTEATSVEFSWENLHIDPEENPSAKKFVQQLHEFENKNRLVPQKVEYTPRFIKNKMRAFLEEKEIEITNYQTLAIFLEMISEMMINIDNCVYLSLRNNDKSTLIKREIKNTREKFFKNFMTKIIEISLPQVPLAAGEDLSRLASSKELIQKQSETSSRTEWDDGYLIWINKQGNITNPFYAKSTTLETIVATFYRCINEKKDILNRFEMKKNEDMTSGEMFRELTVAVDTNAKYFEKYRTRENPIGMNDRGIKLLNEYSFTSDNTYKMLKVFIRLKSNVPVVLIGESGIGKTELLRRLAEIVGIKLFMIQVHAGITGDMLEIRMLEFIEEARGEVCWVFFDEANTTPDIEKIESIIFEKMINNLVIPNNFRFIVAANPYRTLNKKEKTLYNEFKKPEAEESKFAYTVFPLPQSLLNIAFDFGTLQKKDFNLYVEKMLISLHTGLRLKKRSSTTVTSKEESLLKNIQKLIQNCISKAMDYSHEYCLGLSLREVKRFFVLFEYFALKKTFRISSLRNRHRLGYSAALATAMVYYYRLPNYCLRESFSRDVDPFFKNFLTDIPYKNGIIENLFLETAHRSSEMFFPLPPAIAMNKSLKENIFFMMVSIFNKFPLFIIGKPGTSKTLAATLIFQKLKGTDSNNEALKTFPRVDVVTYQGSSSSTSEGITQAFNKVVEIATAQKNLKETDKKELFTVFQFDEIGLAEHTGQKNALKTLHSLLEPGRAQEGSQIPFLGITNYSIDFAKLSRAIVLVKPDPDGIDLKFTANEIMKSFSIPGKIQLFKSDHVVSSITDAYTSIIEKQNKVKRCIATFGLRNYYNLVKDISQEYVLDKDLESISTDQRNLILSSFLRKNFEIVDTGGSSIDPFITFEENLGFTIKTKKNTDYEILIQRNLETPHSRHIMIICDGDYGIFNVINICNEARRAVPHIMYRSGLPEDTEDLAFYANKLINRLIIIMAPEFGSEDERKGQTVVLRGVDMIHSSIFALLNQHYVPVGEHNKVRIAIENTGNLLYSVADDFRVVAILYKDELPETDSAFLNRFEIRNMTMKTLIDNESDSISAAFDELVTFMSRITSELSSSNIFQLFPAFNWSKSRGMVDTRSVLMKDNPTLVSAIISQKGTENVLENAKHLLLNIMEPNIKFLIKYGRKERLNDIRPLIGALTVEEVLEQDYTDSSTFINVLLLETPILTQSIESFLPEGKRIRALDSLISRYNHDDLKEKLCKIILKSTKEHFFLFNLFEYKNTTNLINQLLFLIHDAFTTAKASAPDITPQFFIVTAPPSSGTLVSSFWQKLRLTFTNDVRWIQLLSISLKNPIIQLTFSKSLPSAILESSEEQFKNIIAEVFEDSLFYAGYHSFGAVERSELLNNIKSYLEEEVFVSYMKSLVTNAENDLDVIINDTLSKSRETQHSLIYNVISEARRRMTFKLSPFFQKMFNFGSYICKKESFPAQIFFDLIRQNELPGTDGSDITFKNSTRLSDFPMFHHFNKIISEKAKVNIEQFQAIKPVIAMCKALMDEDDKTVSFFTTPEIKEFFSYSFLRAGHGFELPPLRLVEASMAVKYLHHFTDLLKILLEIDVSKDCTILFQLSEVLNSNVKEEFWFEEFFGFFSAIFNVAYRSGLFEHENPIDSLTSGITADVQPEHRIKILFSNLVSVVRPQNLCKHENASHIKHLIDTWGNYHTFVDCIRSEYLSIAKLEVMLQSLKQLKDSIQIRDFTIKIARAKTVTNIWDLKANFSQNINFVFKIIASVASYMKATIQAGQEDEFEIATIFDQMFVILEKHYPERSNRPLVVRITKQIIMTFFENLSVSNVLYNIDALSALETQATSAFFKILLRKKKVADEIFLVIVEAFESCGVCVTSAFAMETIIRCMRDVLYEHFAHWKLPYANASKNFFKILYLRKVTDATVSLSQKLQSGVTETDLTDPRDLLGINGLRAFDSVLTGKEILKFQRKHIGKRKLAQGFQYDVLLILFRYLMIEKSISNSIPRLQDWIHHLDPTAFPHLSSITVYNATGQILSHLPYNPFNVGSLKEKTYFDKLIEDGPYQNFDKSLTGMMAVSSTIFNMISHHVPERSFEHYTSNITRLNHAHSGTPFGPVLQALSSITGWNPFSKDPPILQIPHNDLDATQTSLLLLAISCRAAAALKKNSLLHMFWNFDGAAPDPKESFIPCMSSSEESVVLDALGEKNIRGIVQCLDCKQIVLWIDNACGQPSPPSGKSFEVTCKCKGKKIIIGDHNVKGKNVKNYHQGMRQDLSRALKEYREHFVAQKGFLLFNTGSVKTLTSMAFRNMTPSTHWITLAIMYGLLYMVSPPGYGVSRPKYFELFSKCLEVLTEVFKRPFDSVLTVLHIAAPLIINCFAHADSLDTDKEREALENKIREELDPILSDVDTFVGEFKRRNNSNQDRTIKRLMKHIEFRKKEIKMHPFFFRKPEKFSISGLFGPASLFENAFSALSEREQANRGFLQMISRDWEKIASLHRFSEYINTCKLVQEFLFKLKVTIDAVDKITIEEFLEMVDSSYDSSIKQSFAKLKVSFERGIEFWNLLPPTIDLQVANNECGEDEIRPQIDSKSQLAFFFPSSRNIGDNHSPPGRFARGAIKFCVGVQNDILDAYALSIGQPIDILPRVDVGSCVQSCFATLPPEKEILTCVFNKVEHPPIDHTLLFDFDGLTDVFHRSLVQGRFKFNNSVPNFNATGRAGIVEILEQIEDTISPQTEFTGEFPELTLGGELQVQLLEAVTQLIFKINMFPPGYFDAKTPIGHYDALSFGALSQTIRSFVSSVRMGELCSFYFQVEDQCGPAYIAASCPALFKKPLPEDFNLMGLADDMLQNGLDKDELIMELETIRSMFRRALLRFLIPYHKYSTRYPELHTELVQQASLLFLLQVSVPVDASYEDFFFDTEAEFAHHLVDNSARLQYYHTSELVAALTEVIGVLQSREE